MILKSILFRLRKHERSTYFSPFSLYSNSYQHTRKQAKLQYVHSIKTMGCPLTCNSLNGFPYTPSNILLMQWHIIHEWLTHSDVTLASAGLTSDINHSTRRDCTAHLPVTDCPFTVYLIKAWLMAVILLSIIVFLPQTDIILNMFLCSQSKQKLVKIYYAKITISRTKVWHLAWTHN